MASGGFFARLANLWRGFWNLLISDAEKKHPEIAYENAINGLVEKYSALKQATAALIRRRDEVTQRLEQERKELAQLEADLNTAVDTTQDDLALALIEKKGKGELEVTSLAADLQQAQAEANEAKASLMTVKEEMQKLKNEKDRMLARMKSAEARIRVQEQIDGISVDAEVKALDNVREHISNTVAQASLNKELQDSDLDGRLKALRAQTGSAGAKAKLEELKKARAQQQEQPTKTM